MWKYSKFFHNLSLPNPLDLLLLPARGWFLIVKLCKTQIAEIVRNNIYERQHYARAHFLIIIESKSNHFSDNEQVPAAFIYFQLLRTTSVSVHHTRVMKRKKKPQVIFVYVNENEQSTQRVSKASIKSINRDI